MIEIKHGQESIFDFIIIEDDYILNYEQIARDDQEKEYTPKEVKEAIFNYCNKYIHSGTVIDVGCGDGYVISKINADFKYAVDISFVNLKRIPKQWNLMKIRENAECMHFDSSVADHVICTDVFEHVLDEKKLAGELKRILKPGGKLYLATPYKQDLSVYDSPQYKRKYKYVHLRSVDDRMVLNFFGDMKLMEVHLIKKGMKYQKIKPYPIKLYIFEKCAE